MTSVSLCSSRPFPYVRTVTTIHHSMTCVRMVVATSALTRRVPIHSATMASARVTSANRASSCSTSPPCRSTVWLAISRTDHVLCSTKMNRWGYFRCPFVLALPEAIQKIKMKENEFCKQCDTALMDIDFNKVDRRRGGEEDRRILSF